MSHVDTSLLHAWLDDEVSAAEAETVEEHLETCGSCQRMLDEAARTRALAGELIADLTDDSVPDWESLVARATQPAERSPDVPPPPPRRLLMPALAWAATLVFAFLLGWQARPPGGPAPEQSQLVAALEPSLDVDESELKARVDRESLQQAPTAESPAAASRPRPATTERRAATPEPRAAEPEPRVAAPEPEAAATEHSDGARQQRFATAEQQGQGAVSRQVASQELGRASARRRERDARAEDVLVPKAETLEAKPAVAPLRKMAAVQFLTADEIERDQPVSAEQQEVAFQGERRPLQLMGAELESTETFGSGMRIEEEVQPGVLRAVYQDPQTGVQVTLLQRFVDSEERVQIGAELGTSPATATLTVPTEGLPSLRWLTPEGVLLTLEADLDEAGLRELALRVR